MLRCYSLLCYYYDITFNYLEKWVWSQNVKIMQCLSITVTLSIITSCYFHVIISPRSIYLYFKRQNKTTFEIGLRFNRKQHAIRFWRDPWNQMDKNKKSFPRQTFSTIMCLSVRLLSRMSRISGAGLLVTNSPSLYSLLSGTTSNLRSSHFKRTKKKRAPVQGTTTYTQLFKTDPQPNPMWFLPCRLRRVHSLIQIRFWFAKQTVIWQQLIETLPTRFNHKLYG